MVPAEYDKRINMRREGDNRTTGQGADIRQGPVPVYYNPDAGSSEKVLQAIGSDARIRLEPVSPVLMKKTILGAVEQGAKRILISGGDGTIAIAASCLAGKDIELAVIPSGTLNHFAQRTGIPVEAEEAINVALHGKAQPVDVGYVNDALFINTSSVGAYPVFVRSRNYLENRMHYVSASIIAGLRRLVKFRPVRVQLEGRKLRTPLVFIGVGERDLRLPAPGRAKNDGTRGLHLLAVNCDNMIKIFTLVTKSFFWGIDPMQNEASVENQM
ncbi:MAG: diacylglycerol/lipid kinase family protein, partial [Desulforhopalus sp.]